MKPALAWRLARLFVPITVTIITFMLVLVLVLKDANFIVLIIAGGFATHFSRILVVRLHAALLLHDMRRQPAKYAPKIISGEIPPLVPELIEVGEKLTEIGAEPMGAAMKIGVRNRQFTYWYFTPTPVTWIAEITFTGAVRLSFETTFQTKSSVLDFIHLLDKSRWTS